MDLCYCSILYYDVFIWHTIQWHFLKTCHEFILIWWNDGNSLFYFMTHYRITFLVAFLLAKYNVTIFLTFLAYYTMTFCVITYYTVMFFMTYYTAIFLMTYYTMIWNQLYYDFFSRTIPWYFLTQYYISFHTITFDQFFRHTIL